MASRVLFSRPGGSREERSRTPDGQSDPTWAYLFSDRAQIMVAKAGEPVVPSQQAVLFYVYCDDVPPFRENLVARGVEAGPIAYPFYAPRGEFRIEDPDGNVLMVTHT